MTEPTQAQIEADAMAALKNELEFQRGRNPSAAAGIAWAIEQIERLTAAAQVGGSFDDGYKYKEAECRDEITAAIERCAQELEAAYAECATLNLLHGAARLRAMKDEA